MKNRKLMAITIALILLFTMAMPAFAGQIANDDKELTGSHYQINIIGVQNVKTADMDNSNGRTIFVPLEGSANIYLKEGPYAVIDANGTDRNGATFQLPKPGYDAYVIGDADGKDVISDYSIYVRPLGKPDGFSEITTCAELVSSGALFAMLPSTAQKTIKNAIKGDTGAYASVEQVGSDITMRTQGKTNWTNVTAQLTSIVFEIWTDLNDNGIEDPGEINFIRVPIFDDLLAGEYWFYDNSGLKNLQVRFYEWGTDVTYGDLLL